MKNCFPHTFLFFSIVTRILYIYIKQLMVLLYLPFARLILLLLFHGVQKIDFLIFQSTNIHLAITMSINSP